MRAVIQRVDRAAISADGVPCGDGTVGLFVLLGIAPTDTASDVDLLANKIVKMRVFSDDAGKMNRALSDVDGTLYLVSNFTLYANCRHGNRPDFFGAASPALAEELYDLFVSRVRSLHSPVVCGRFGADMKIDTVCSGPVTIVLDSESLKR